MGTAAVVAPNTGAPKVPNGADVAVNRFVVAVGAAALDAVVFATAAPKENENVDVVAPPTEGNVNDGADNNDGVVVVAAAAGAGAGAGAAAGFAAGAAAAAGAGLAAVAAAAVVAPPEDLTGDVDDDAVRASSYAVLNAPATSASLNFRPNVVRFSSSSEKSSAVYTHMLSLSERPCCDRGENHARKTASVTVVTQ